MSIELINAKEMKRLINKQIIRVLFFLLMNSLSLTMVQAQERPVDKDFPMVLTGPEKTIIVVAAAFIDAVDEQRFSAFNEHIRVERADRGGRSFKKLAEVQFPKSAIDMEKRLGHMLNDVMDQLGVQSATAAYDKLLKEGPRALGILLINPDLQEAMGLTFMDRSRDPRVASTYRLTKIASEKEGQQRNIDVAAGVAAYTERYQIASLSPSDSLVSMSWFSVVASKDSPFPLIARVYKQDGHNQGFKEQTRTLVTGSTTLSDSTFVYHSDRVEPGRNLAYYMQIEDFAGNKGLSSDTIYMLSVSKASIKPIMNLQAVDTLGGILLTWDSIPDQALYGGIQILKSRKVTEDYVVLDTIPAKELRFLDDRIINSSVYYYRVRPLLLDLPDSDPMQFAEITGYVGRRDSVAPQAPAQVSAQVLKEGVQLNWQQGEELNLFGYYVLRGTSPRDMAVISAAVQANTYLDTSITPGFSGQLQYAVQAISLNQQVSDTSAVASVSILRPVNLTPAGGLAARWQDGSVALNWDDVMQRDDKVDGYLVYRKPTDAKVFELITKELHPLPFFTDTTAVSTSSYSYAVTSIDAWGNQSILSPTSTVDAVVLQTVVLPQELYLRNLSNGIEVFWPEVSFSPGEKYILYRKVMGQSNFMKIATIDPDKPFVDSEVRTDQLYEYQLKVVSGKGESKNGVSKTIRR